MASQLKEVNRMRRLASFTRAEGMRVRVFDADREQAPASSPQGGVLIPRQLLRRVGQGPLHPLLSFCQRKKKAFVGRGARRGENSDNGAESRRSHSSAKADHRFNEAPTPPGSLLTHPTRPIPRPRPLGTCSLAAPPPAGRVQPVSRARRLVPKCGAPRREGRRSEAAPKTDG